METQSQKVKDIYEVVSTHFALLLFNQIYSIAKTRKTDSLYDSYVSCANIYVSSVRSDKEKFNTMAQQVYEYFIKITPYSSLGYTGFVDTVVGASTPAVYFPKLSRERRDELFDSIICDVLTGMTSYVLQPEILEKIVGNNRMNEHKTTTDLQAHGVEIMFSKRSSIISKMFQRNEQVRTGQESTAFVNLKIEFRETLKKKIAAENQIVAQGDRIRLMEITYKKMKARMQAKIEELEEYNEQLKNKLKEQNSGSKKMPKKPIKLPSESENSEESDDEPGYNRDVGASEEDEESEDEESGNGEESVEEEVSSGEELEIELVDDILDNTVKDDKEEKYLSRPPNPNDQGYTYENPYGY